MSGLEMTEAGSALAALGALAKIAFHQGRIDTNMKRTLAWLEDLENRMRDVEHAKAVNEGVEHAKAVDDGRPLRVRRQPAI